MAKQPQTMSVGYIPDLSTAPLYLSVVQDLAGSPDQLAVWCMMAVYHPFDVARKQPATTQEWLDRSGLPIERLDAAWTALMQRGLATRAGIPGGLLRLESLSRAEPFCNYLRTLGTPAAKQDEMEFGEQR